MTTPTYTVLVDMDAIVADLATDWYALYNKTYPDRKPVVIDNVTNWDVGKTIGDRAIYGLLDSPGLYTGLKPIPNSIDALKALSKMQWLKTGQPVYDIVFLTAAIAQPHILTDKSIWLRKHFPFIPVKNHIYAYRKEMVRGDFFIDDSPKNLLKWKAANPDGVTITFDYPYNKNAEVDYRAGSYKDLSQAWAAVLDYFQTIRKVAEAVSDEERGRETIQ